MALTVEKASLTLMSQPCFLRPGFIAMIIALIIGFIFSLLWLTLATYLIFTTQAEQVVWGVLIGLSTILYCTYMVFVALKLKKQSKDKYILELTSEEVVLSCYDCLDGKTSGNKRSVQMVLLSDIKYAEYYPYSDSGCVYLHTPYVVMEVPLWTFGSCGQDVIDFLVGRGVEIVNIQSDDVIKNAG